MPDYIMSTWSKQASIGGNVFLLSKSILIMCSTGTDTSIGHWALGITIAQVYRLNHNSNTSCKCLTSVCVSTGVKLLTVTNVLEHARESCSNNRIKKKNQSHSIMWIDLNKLLSVGECWNAGTRIRHLIFKKKVVSMHPESCGFGNVRNGSSGSLKYIGTVSFVIELWLYDRRPSSLAYVCYIDPSWRRW